MVKKTGAKKIAAIVSGFEKTVDELQAAIVVVEEKKSANRQKINELNGENSVLDKSAATAVNLITGIRKIINGGS